MRGEDRSRRVVGLSSGGSPPHARGRLAAELRFVGVRRITPACAGKTTGGVTVLASLWDHPRMRGEDRRRAGEKRALQGSPPHARGRRGTQSGGSLRTRITPACAGKTARRPAHRASPRDHPRMRGEDCRPSSTSAKARGSPPHARGRRSSWRPRPSRPGITPACAGKTMSLRPCSRVFWDHPRMRGEDTSPIEEDIISQGSPPHARGRHNRPG